MGARPHAASYRDPSARIFEGGGRLFRFLDAAGLERHRRVVATGLTERLVADGLLVPARDAPELADEARRAGYAGALEHERLPFVSYPYEWPFALLRRAALLPLDIH